MSNGAAYRPDYFTKAEIEEDIRRIDELLVCGIFQAANAGHVLFRAAFIELLIAVRDLMHKTEKFAHRIDFADDVKQIGKVTDVTGLIKHVRDALCHPDSDNHYIEVGNIKSTFNVAFGRANLLKMKEFEQASAYPDDTCFFFGPHGIYLNRHICRAFEEAKQALRPILDDQVPSIRYGGA